MTRLFNYRKQLNDDIYTSVESFLLAILGLSIGFGLDIRISAGCYLCLLLSDRQHLHRLQKNIPLSKVWLILVSLFCLFYWLNYEPTIYRRHDTFITSLYKPNDWLILLAWISLSILPLIGASDNIKKYDFIIAELIGCSLWGIAIIGFSIIKFPPPYYGNLHNPIFGFNINSAGPAYLISMSALLFYGQFIHNFKANSLWFKTFCSLLFLVAIFESIFIQQRTFYIISFLVCPLLLMLLLRNKRSINKIWLMLIGCVPLAYFSLKSLIEKNFEAYRKLGFNLTGDLRIRLYKNWFDQFIENPLSRIHVTLLENPVHGIPTSEFHNFFMDVNRFSGLTALLLSIILFAYIFFTLINCLKNNPRLGKISIFLFIPLFLIICTAVFPEGEIQFLLIIFSIISFIKSAQVESKPN